MTKVAKYIIVVLAVLFLGSLYLALQSNSSRESALRQAQGREAELRKSMESMSSQLSAAQADRKRAQDKLDALQKDFSRISSERDDWKNKYDAVSKEKEALLSKLQQIPRITEKPKEVTPAPQVTPDEYWAAVLKEKAELELHIKSLQTELAEDKLKVEDFKRGKTEMELELSRLKQIQDDLQRKLKQSTELADTLSLALARDKNDKRFISDKLAALKNENADLRSKVKELTTTKLTLQKNLQKLIEDKATVEAQLAKTEEIVKERINEMMDIKNEIEAATKTRAATGIEGKTVQLPPIIVKAAGTPKTEISVPFASRVNARVVSVNTANNFVIIDIGESSGVKVGDTFKVFRDNKEIAMVEVIQARPDISAADIKQKTQDILSGDLVK
ncbi:MAG: hypothetical protein ACOY3D_08740 [Candidatus Omnitrophota bacterium]